MTTAFSPAEPIGTFAKTHPHTLATLDAFRLDYCCHGSRTIAQACHAAGVHLDDLQRALSTPSLKREEPATWSAQSLIDDINQTHHVTTRAAFQRIDALVVRVVKAHGRKDPRLLALHEIVTELRDEMLAHMDREEQVLFPWILRLTSGQDVTAATVRQPIDCMEHDHADVAAAFDRIRELTDDCTPPTWACMTYVSLLQALKDLEADTRRHIHKENNLLFPLALQAEDALRNRGHA